MKVVSKNSVPYILQMSAAKSSRLAEKIPEVDELGLGPLSKEENRVLNLTNMLRIVEDKEPRKVTIGLRLPEATVKADIFMLRETARQAGNKIKLNKGKVKVGPHMNLNRGAYNPDGPTLGSAPAAYTWA